MSDIVAVLVVAAEGDPGGLLAPGRCGAQPPMVHRAVRELYTGTDLTWERLQLGDWSTLGSVGASTESALPLWWDGQLVPEGWDRARRVLWTRGRHIHPAHHYVVHAIEVESLDLETEGASTSAQWLAVELVRQGFGSRVVRLARADGRLVEVP